LACFSITKIAGSAFLKISDLWSKSVHYLYLTQSGSGPYKIVGLQQALSKAVQNERVALNTKIIKLLQKRRGGTLSIAKS